MHVRSTLNQPVDAIDSGGKLSMVYNENLAKLQKESNARRERLAKDVQQRRNGVITGT
jgi:hypothetical protein